MKSVRRLVAGLWGGLTLVIFMRSAEPAELVGIPLWIVASLASIAIHEAGHAAGAFFSGWRVVVFSVWRLAWHVPLRRVTILRASDLKEVWGWVLAVPGSAHRDTIARHAVFIAGGPLANLLQACVAVIWAATIPPDAKVLGVEAQLLLAGFALIGLGLFVGNTAPLRTRVVENDGYQLTGLLRGVPPANPLRAAGWAAALLDVNVRLRDLPQ